MCLCLVDLYLISNAIALVTGVVKLPIEAADERPRSGEQLLPAGSLFSNIARRLRTPEDILSYLLGESCTVKSQRDGDEMGCQS